MKEIVDLNWTIESVRDFYQHSLELWEKANAGEYGPIEEYVPPAKNEFEQLMENYKNQFDGDFSLDKI